MSYKSFSVNIVIRLVLIFIAMVSLSFFIQKGSYWATCGGILLLIMIQCFLLIKYIEKTHRELNHFFEAILIDDFNSYSHLKLNSPIGIALYEKFTLVQQRFQSLRYKHQELVSYYTLLLEKVPVAIVIVEGKKLTLANSAAQKLFQRSQLESVDYLNQFGSQLKRDVQDILPGEQRTSQIVSNQAANSVTLSATNIQMSDGIRKIVSINPIQRELDRQEMIAWQNLVQVFTHEIMNSMTPIASLSKTAADLLLNIEAKADCERNEIVADAHQAINVVARRADNLMDFVQAYRRIANPPIVHPESIDVKHLFGDVCQLLHELAASKHIELGYHVVPENLILCADPAQVEQVLINLLKNSIEAIKHSDDGKVAMHAYIGGDGNVVVEVVDNGCGIPADKLEQVFVPFFTSKREGTGVGLFLVKQIMQAHKGSVYAMQAEQGGTIIRLIF